MGRDCRYSAATGNAHRMEGLWRVAPQIVHSWGSRWPRWSPWAVVAYNRLVRQRNEIANAFAQIDVQLKRRYDLDPEPRRDCAQVRAARARHARGRDRGAQHGARRAADARARTRRPTARASRALAGAERHAGRHAGAARWRSSRRYPELKADATLRELSEELTHTENRIAFARQAFNDAVLDYNNAAQQAPGQRGRRRLRLPRRGAMLQATTSDAERAGAARAVLSLIHARSSRQSPPDALSPPPGSRAAPATRRLLVLFALVVVGAGAGGQRACWPLAYWRQHAVRCGFPDWFFETNTALVLLLVLGGCCGRDAAPARRRRACGRWPAGGRCSPAPAR